MRTVPLQAYPDSPELVNEYSGRIGNIPDVQKRDASMLRFRKGAMEDAALRLTAKLSADESVQAARESASRPRPASWAGTRPEPAQGRTPARTVESAARRPWGASHFGYVPADAADRALTYKHARSRSFDAARVNGAANAAPAASSPAVAESVTATGPTGRR